MGIVPTVEFDSKDAACVRLDEHSPPPRRPRFAVLDTVVLVIEGSIKDGDCHLSLNWAVQFRRHETGKERDVEVTAVVNSSNSRPLTFFASSLSNARQKHRLMLSLREEEFVWKRSCRSYAVWERISENVRMKGVDGDSLYLPAVEKLF